MKRKSAPTAAALFLFERARQAGVRRLERNTALLVLPRSNEALAVKDEGGVRVQTVEDGYDLESEYASTVRATNRCEGEWPNLDYGHHLGYGERKLAALALEPAVDGFKGVAGVMEENPEYAEAKDLFQQTQRVLESASRRSSPATLKESGEMISAGRLLEEVRSVKGNETRTRPRP